jgi:hypothetical protein
MTHQHPANQTNDTHTTLANAGHANQRQTDNQSALTPGNPALLAALGLAPSEKPLPEPLDNEITSLSRALTGDERLQAYLVTDYLSSLNTEETASVAGLLAEDTLAMLNNLAIDPDNTNIEL